MRDLKIAYGGSCFAVKWSNKTIGFDELCDRLKTTIRTPETVEEYPKLPKTERDRTKDKGGFVGGALKGGRRKRETVECRSMLTLDADHAELDFLEQYKASNPPASCVYSTHGHTPDAPRLRIIIPLSRDVTPDEYNAVARYFAEGLGIDQFDECSYRPHQLMYWPSTPSNGEYICEVFGGDWLDPDVILGANLNWRDCALLPTSSRESAVKPHVGGRQQDPLTKEGVVGAFCRVYSVEDAIAAFLPGIYEPSQMDGRYDYIPADSSAGVVVYDGKWVYSHHATDPACGRLLNAFDLVRVHKFPDLDEKAGFKAMNALAIQDENVKILIVEERSAEAHSEFAADGDWKKRLTLCKDGSVEESLENLSLILEHDENLAGIAYNELKSSIDFISPPAWEPIKYPAWTDNDTSQLRCYISDVYGIYSPGKTQDALNKAAAARHHHPIRDYLNALPAWDGVKRVETLLIDYLGAEDNDYIRAVTRKTLVAAVARVFVPGIKFDSVLVMDGPQEKGKSTLFNKLAGDEWFNDGLTLTDMQDKSGAEKLQGYWILEIGELTGMRKSDIDSVKSFISRRDDKYRASYGRVVESHPRQCIIVATVNSMGGFLRDPTGNRRFWPVATPGGSDRHSWDITAEEVQQIWAETVALWRGSEKLYLEGSVKEAAAQEQNAALETDPREGMVRDYLDRLLPETWDEMDLYRRREFLQGDAMQPKGTVCRESVCALEIWSECFSKAPETIKRADSYELSATLRKLGWVQAEASKRIPLYGKQRLWMKP